MLFVGSLSRPSKTTLAFRAPVRVAQVTTDDTRGGRRETIPPPGAFETRGVSRYGFDTRRPIIARMALICVMTPNLHWASYC
jgi:hypothetical protein